MNSISDNDTIVAPLTPPGTGAVIVVRVSGGLVTDLVTKLAAKSHEIATNPRRAVYGDLYDILPDAPHAVLDDAVTVFFAGPASFTGEDCVEFSIHGSPYILDRLLKNILHCGTRLAQPGEFSKRAYLNGRLDLAQAEAIADLINAQSAAQARVARQQLAGQLSGVVAALGEPLRELLSEIEAFIDFPEDDIEPLTQEGWRKVLHRVVEEMDRYLATYSTGRLLREGARVAIVGAPNAGKSSLLNRLVGEDRAIVTPIPGTTRDVIAEHIALDGVKVTLWDTAGIALDDDALDKEAVHNEARRVVDPVEKLGVERSWKQLKQADAVLFVVDVSLPLEQQQLLFSAVTALPGRYYVVGNKVDLIPSVGRMICSSELRRIFGEQHVLISTVTGEGLPELRAALGKLIMGEGVSSDSSMFMLTNLRHFDALTNARENAVRAGAAITEQLPPEVIALELRLTLALLSDIVGVTHSDEILGRIFAKFCIGK